MKRSTYRDDGQVCQKNEKKKEEMCGPARWTLCRMCSFLQVENTKLKQKTKIPDFPTIRENINVLYLWLEIIVREILDND